MDLANSKSIKFGVCAFTVISVIEGVLIAKFMSDFGYRFWLVLLFSWIFTYGASGLYYYRFTINFTADLGEFANGSKSDGKFTTLFSMGMLSVLVIIQTTFIIYGPSQLAHGLPNYRKATAN